MNRIYDDIKNKALSAMRALAKDCPSYADAKMLIASSETAVSLKRNKVHKKIDSEWIERIEATIPYIDVIVRNPSIMIEDVDEVLPVEVSRHITEKSIKHLAQHTNLILDVKDDEITPSKILNVYHDETLLTYENKFVNTLIARLSAFVDKRYKALMGGSGTEANYKFDYQTEFEHFTSVDEGRNSARINLRIELTSPLGAEISESDIELNESYKDLLERVRRISNTITSFQSSAFVQSLKRNYIRPPVIRTNAILKNKNMKECLNLWEYIETFDKVGYSFIGDEYKEMPSDDFVASLHSPVALEYTTFYHGVVEGEEEKRLLSEKHLFETFPEFDDELNNEELEDYQVYDSEYKKTVPVSRLMNNRKKLSEDEKRIRDAIVVALRVDEILNAEEMAKEAEARRLAREARIREEEERKRLEEEERARRQAELDALRKTVEIRYRRSYMSRLIQAEDQIKGFYSIIKNELLSYEGVKARTSWTKETFKKGRQPIARIDVKGKMLCLYLALDPKEADEKYRVVDVSSKAGGDEYPSLLKIRSDRGIKYALDLIAKLMASLEIAKLEREPEDFTIPYEDDDALIERGLIKVVLPDGAVLDEYTDIVKANVSGFFDENGEGVEKQDAASDETEEGETAEAAIPAGPIEIRYRRSFISRFIQAEDYIKDYYNEIKNYILSYKGVKSRTSWSKETFKRGRLPIARIDVKGKTLCLYLALEPKDIPEKYHASDISEKRGGDEYPTLLKVRSDRAKKYAIELIAEIMDKYSIPRVDAAAEDFRLPYEDDAALIERGLIKLVIPKGVVLSENDETVRANISAMIGERAPAPEAEKTAEAAPATESEESAEPEFEAEIVEISEGAEETAPVSESEAETEPEIEVEVVEIAEEEAPAAESEAETEPEIEVEVVEIAEEEAPAAESEAETEPEAPAIEEQTAAIETEESESDEADEQTDESIDYYIDEGESAVIEAASESEESEEDENEVYANAVSMAIADIEEEAVLEMRLDAILTSDSDNSRVTILNALGSPLVIRKRFSSTSGLAHVFADSKNAKSATVLVPYTRAQYLALPRKKKKSVLTTVRHMIDYNTTKKLLDALKLRRLENPRILERIARLEERLAEESKFLPTARLWEESVKRLKK